MIIVDDCSIDETVSIIKDYSVLDSRIKFFQLDANSGAGIARNTALRNASGRYIAFLDSDDLWKPDKLQKQISFMTENVLPFTFSYYDCIDEEGKPLNKEIRAPKTLSYNQLFFCNYVGNLTGIYDVNYFGKIDISSFRKRQDWIMWLTVLKKIRVAKPVQESLALYRIRKESISSSKVHLLKHNFSVYRNFHRFNVFISALCMLGFLTAQFVIKPMYVIEL